MTADSIIPAFRLRPPRVPVDLMPRPRVTSALLATEPGGACVIAAAPGYGATTALRQVVVDSSDDARWVSLDDSVSDAVACALVCAAVGARSATGPDFVSALAAADSVWLVIDGLVPDVHVTLAAQIALLCERTPPSARVIISCHEDFAVPGARCYDENLLRFRPDEAFDLVNRVAGQPDMDEVSALIGAAQGWGNALVAGSQRLRTAYSIAGWLRDQAAAELLGPWFTLLPTSRQELLVRTAVLDVVGEGPAGRITADPRIGDRLRDLQAAHCYVRTVDPPPGHTDQWWQRHPLLTVMLRHRGDLDAVTNHAGAADWFGEVGDVRAAIPHLLAAGRLNAAAQLLTAHESALLSSGEAQQVVQWYDKIADTQNRGIESLLRTAWGLALARDIPAADAALAQVRAAIVTQQNAREPADTLEVTRWHTEEELLRAYLAAFHGDPRTVIASATKAMDDPGADGSRDAVQLAPLLVVRGLFWSGQPRAAARLLATVEDKPHPNDVLRELHLAGLRALVMCANGRVRDAAAVLERMDRWIAAEGVNPLAIQIFVPELARAWVALESGDLEQSQANATAILEQATMCSHLSDATWACILLAGVQMARGDYGAAMRELANGRRLATSQTPHSTLCVPVDQAQALVHMAAGDTVRAERLIQRLPLGRTRALLSARAGLQRQPVLSRRTLEAVEAVTPRLAAQRHVLLAAIHARSSPLMAQGHLREAGAVAARNGMRQVLVPPVTDVLDLAEQMVRERGDADLAWLLSMPTTTDATHSGQVRGVLSRGELQLLAILPSRTKNADIAERLGVSVNTVKTRLRRLYAKLGAANRDEAIERARQRGLLDVSDDR